MNSKIMYTALLLGLGGLAMNQPAWSKPGNANSQSIKKCPFKRSQADVVLSKSLTFGHVNDNATLLDPTDDFYEICSNANFTVGCVAQTNPASTPLAVDLGGNVYEYNGLLIYGSNKADTIFGTQGDDEICGNNGKDLISGEGGDDSLHGNNASDTLIGGVGDDDLHGGNGQDVLFGYEDDDSSNYPGEGEDLNDDAVVDDLDTDQDELDGGNGRDDLSGGPDDDTLFGGNARDSLNGNGGDDSIDGGRGNDDCVDDGDGAANDDCEASEADD